MTRRVIHIVESLDKGAIEAWLVRMLRYARKHDVALDWTFYCALGAKGRMDDEVRDLGARIVYSPVSLHNKLQFLRALRAEIKRGEYDVLHSHHDLVSGVYMLASYGMGIDRTIVHVHNTVNGIPARKGLKRAAMQAILRRICFQADTIAGVSNKALDFFLDGRPRRAGRDVVHYCGVETLPFEQGGIERAGFRRELGFSEEARILLFAGRIVPEKEPIFAVDVLAEMRRSNDHVVGVFVGSGPLTDSLARRAAELGLANSFRSLGWRSDIARIMACSDCFIQPGPEEPPEGLGLAVVEAQLAGLHLLFSLGIPDDALLPGASYRRVPLKSGAKCWADAGLDLMMKPLPSRAAAIEHLRGSPFDMSRALLGLLALHDQAIPSSHPFVAMLSRAVPITTI